MKKFSNYKSLYQFTKKQKVKDSTSTKDLDDSLQKQQLVSSQNISEKHLNMKHKIPHNRTHSCPMPAQPVDFDFLPKNELVRANTICGKEGGKKPSHRHYHSQASLDALSNSQQNLSIQNLSTALYRKQVKDGGLKKSGAGISLKGRVMFINQEQYNRTRVQQQIKTYQLHQQLAEIERKRQGLSIKQQILQSLVNRFEGQEFSEQ